MLSGILQRICEQVLLSDAHLKGDAVFPDGKARGCLGLL